MTDFHPLDPSGEIIMGVRGQMLRAGHCSICGAVLAISADGTPFKMTDPDVVKHIQWHEAISKLTLLSA